MSYDETSYKTNVNMMFGKLGQPGKVHGMDAVSQHRFEMAVRRVRLRLEIHRILKARRNAAR